MAIEETEEWYPSCSTCEYFELSGEEAGICHRFPPQVVFDPNDNKFEHVLVRASKHYWCGEYLPGDEAQRPASQTN